MSAARQALPDAVHRHLEWEVEQAYAQGYADGLARADADELRALVTALGGADCPGWRVAVERHERALARVDRRRRADAGDPALLAEAERERQRVEDEQRRHNARRIREAMAAGPAITNLDQVRELVSPSVWLRIWERDLAPMTRARHPHLDPARPRRAVRRAA